jgi:hypothetical protein
LLVGLKVVRTIHALGVDACVAETAGAEADAAVEVTRRAAAAAAPAIVLNEGIQVTPSAGATHTKPGKSDATRSRHKYR